MSGNVEQLSSLVERAKAVDKALQQKYERHKSTIDSSQQQRMEASQQQWANVVARVEATTKFLQDYEILGISIEAAVSSKEELVLLWDLIDSGTARIEQLEKQLSSVFQDREILLCRLIASNVTNKMARLVIPKLTVPKKAIGYNLHNLSNHKLDTVRTKVAEYTSRYPEFSEGLEFLLNAGLSVAHPKALVETDGTEKQLTDTVLENCIKGAFGEDHEEYQGMKSVLNLLKDLSTDLEEKLIIDTYSICPSQPS